MQSCTEEVYYDIFSVMAEGKNFGVRMPFVGV